MKKNLPYNIIFNYIPKIFSVVFHPLIIPTLGIYIILTSSGTNAYLLDWQDKNIIISLVAAFTLVIPLAFLPFYLYFKISNTITISIRQQRIVPLLVTSILYYACFMIFHIKGAPHLVQSFLFASTISVFCTLLITLRWQISAHLIGIGGINGLVLSLNILYHIEILGYLMLSILLAGLISFSRLSLDAHTPKQAYSGLLVGFFITTFSIFLY
jgi:hypothetical protein